MNKKLKLDALNRLSPEEFKTVKKLPVIVALDNIRSMHNVGSIFRTSDALAIEKIILAGITPIPPHRDIRKTAIGATETVEWEHVENLHETLQNYKETHTIISVEQTTNSIEPEQLDIQSNSKIVLVFGNEVGGVSDEIITISDDCLELPQYGTKHSFNVSVCAGIVLWEVAKKLR